MPETDSPQLAKLHEGAVVIERRKGSPNLQIQMKIPGGTPTRFQSKTSNLEDAKSVATKAYLKMLGRDEHGMSPLKKHGKFGLICDEYLATLQKVIDYSLGVRVGTNDNAPNHLHIHDQGDNTQGGKRQVEEGAKEDYEYPHVAA